MFLYTKSQIGEWFGQIWVSQVKPAWGDLYI